MNALLYKICQLLKCKQVFNYCCNSSYGFISLQRSSSMKNLIPDTVYNKYQTKIYNNKSITPIKTICTWNIQELWWHSYKGHKINNIIKYIINSEYDVLCLQEVFEPYVQKMIVGNSQIRKKYPYFLTGDLYNRFIIGENSGLMVLSSQPILFKQFTPFCKSTFPDTFASKGALYFTIGEINFITTHLQSDDNRVAVLQLKYIIKNSPFHSKTILLGDLNIPNPYILLNIPSYCKKHTHDSGRQLDHIIPLQSDIKIDTTDVDYIDIKNTSDHWPLFSKLVKH